MLRRILLLLLALPASSISYADERFPVGVPVETRAMFCIDKASAQVIADARGDVPDALILGRKCTVLHGIAVYVKKVYEKDGWAVWELHSDNVPVFYEATNWKPIPKGIEI